MIVTLLIAIIALILISAFFSISETSMMSLNRYRLRHLARHKHKAAMRAYLLLKRPDRLLGTILTGNTFANIIASALTTLLASHLWGDKGVAVATLLLTISILIFGEILPKTFAALHPERCAFILTRALTILLRLCYPLVWLMNCIANGILKLLGIHTTASSHDPLTTEELRSVVHESKHQLAEHQHMLLGVLGLERMTVADVMTPRQKIIGIDLDKSWKEILDQLQKASYSRLPVYHDTIEDIVGILDLRKLAQLFTQNNPNKKSLLDILSEPYFVPIHTSLRKQLSHFQEKGHEQAVVVDEYGEIQGLITLEDILEEIAGEFTLLEQPSSHKAIRKAANGWFIIHADLTLRDINRKLNLELPTEGPKTLSGLIIEHLEELPTPGTSLMIAHYPIEIIRVEDNTVLEASIGPRLEDTNNPQNEE